MSIIEYFEWLRQKARDRMDKHAAEANWTGFNYQLGQVIAFGVAIRKLQMTEAQYRADKAGEE